LEVEVAAEINFGEGFSDERRVREDEDFGDVGADAELFEKALGRCTVGDEAAADEEHVGETDEGDGNADGGEFEHAQRLELSARHETADDEIR